MNLDQLKGLDLEEIFDSGEVARQVQSLSAEQKAELDWNTRLFLSYDERAKLCKETVIEWNIYKFKCKPFTMGLYADAEEVGVLGRLSPSDVFRRTAGLLLEGVTSGAQSFAYSGLVEDVLNVGPDDPQKFNDANTFMEAVRFFFLHYRRLGLKLRKAQPGLVKQEKKTQSRSKSQKAAK